MSVRAALVVTLLAASSAAAQDPVFQSPKKLTFHGEGLLREEWTRDFQGVDSDRFRARALPGLRLTLGPVVLGAAGDFQWSSDENVVAGQPLIRDNYDSRDARVDLAFARLETGAVELAAGRFEMPIAFTEMIWDRDLRPQGGALTLALRDRGSLKRLALTALGARGSHVFDDDDTTMLSAALDARFDLDDAWRLELLGAFVTYLDPEKLEAKIRRQNTRVAGAIVRDYDVVDAIVRFRRDGSVPAAGRRRRLPQHRRGRPQPRALAVARRSARRSPRASGASTSTPSSTPTRRSPRTRPTTSSGRPAGPGTRRTSGWHSDDTSRSTASGSSSGSRTARARRSARTG